MSAPPERPVHDDGATRSTDEVEHARFMAEAGRILGESLDVGTTLRRVASLAVPRIADWCAIELLTDDGRLEELALVHDDPAKIDIVLDLRRHYPADPRRESGSYAVARTGEPIVVAEITPELVRATAVDDRQAALLEALELRSFMCVPLRSLGRVVGTLTLATDGSGRRFGPDDLTLAEDLAGRAATAIANSRAFGDADRFRRILDALAEAVFVIDPGDGRIRDVNHGAVMLLGLGRSSIIGRRIWDFAVDIGPADARELVRPLLDGHLEGRSISARMRDGSGTSDGRPVDVLLQRVDLESERPALVAIARDVRERVEAQGRLERLAEAERARAAELDAVIRAMGDGVIVCDVTGRVTLANPAAQDLFPGLAEATWSGILGALHDPDGVAPTLGSLGGPVVLRMRGTTDRWIEVATYPVARPSGPDDDPRTDGTSADGHGASGETIIVLRDVTETRRREAVRETFVGVLSHELRTPLTTIYGGAKVLSRAESTLDEATRRIVFADIVAEAERLQRLVEDVVALNRFGGPGGDLGTEPVLLQRIVPDVVRSEAARWPGVAFEPRVPPGLPTVVADRTYVEQVVRNLLSNAAKYGGGDGTIEVILEPGGDEVAVRILDGGPGIDPSEAAQLFELFYRSPSTAGTTSGAGIGLFVCARLVAAMGGRIWAVPRPSGGSEFGFALRIMAEA